MRVALAIRQRAAMVTARTLVVWGGRRIDPLRPNGGVPTQPWAFHPRGWRRRTLVGPPVGFGQFGAAEGLERLRPQCLPSSCSTSTRTSSYATGQSTRPEEQSMGEPARSSWRSPPMSDRSTRQDSCGPSSMKQPNRIAFRLVYSLWPEPQTSHSSLALSTSSIDPNERSEELRHVHLVPGEPVRPPADSGRSAGGGRKCAGRTIRDGRHLPHDRRVWAGGRPR